MIHDFELGILYLKYNLTPHFTYSLSMFLATNLVFYLHFQFDFIFLYI